MLIYHAYLDHGPHDGERTIGYYASVNSAAKAITDDARRGEEVLGIPYRSFYRQITWPIEDAYGLSYVIETIEVQP